MSCPDREFEGASCRVCGCTEDNACAGGCCWVPDPGQGELCSSCLVLVYRALGRLLRREADPVDRAILARFADVDLPDDGPPPARLALVRLIAEPISVSISVAA